MSTSPDLLKDSQPTFTVKVDGKELDATVGVLSVDTWSEVNRVPKARLVIYDGSASQSDFPLSNTNTFLPGKKVEIAAGYRGEKEVAIFKGVIVKQGLEIDQTQASKLIVEVTDEAVKMTLERKNGLFEKIKDSDLIGELISRNGLRKSVAATNTVNPEIVQYYASDWDLMLTRAEINGLIVTVAGGEVTVKAPDTRQAPVLNVDYGDSILDLDAEMDAATQFSSSAIKSFTWDPAEQKLIDSGPGAVTVEEPGNVSSATLAKVFGVKRFTQQTGAMVEKTSLKDWSSAELLKSKLSKIRGSVRFQGSAKALPGKTLELEGLGERFNGKVFLSGVHHCLREGRWLTTAQFGLSSKWFAAEAPHLAAPEASGQLPPIEGLQTGIVRKVAKDPGGEFRVLVSLPLLQAGSKGVWARLATFYASKKLGAVFYPEVGDEVVVAFMNQDPRYPVILGSVYSKKLPPLYPPDDKNNKKAVTTRGKLELIFDDKDKILEIKTPKHVIKMDDKSGAVSIKDGNKNTVSLSKGGIALESASNVKINAKGNITIKAGGNLKLTATANTTVEGLQISNKAKAKYSAKGNAQAEVTSTGILTVRGSLVKIN